MICPLHGPVWRENLGWFIDKYQKWSTYTPEDHAVLIVYASIYGNTESAVNVLAGKISDAGERTLQCMMCPKQIRPIFWQKHSAVTGSYLPALLTMQDFSRKWKPFFQN